jgi:hypothetical protein
LGSFSLILFTSTFSASIFPNPIAKLSSKDGADQFDVEVRDLTPELADYWARSVQPEVETADSTWNWDSFLKFHQLCRPGFSLAGISSVIGAITLNKPNVHRFPLGFFWALGPFATSVKNGRQSDDPLGVSDHLYIAFISATPKAFLTSKNLPDIRAGNALIDCSLQLSLMTNAGGALVLHADSKSGDGLLDYYVKNGFSQLPKGSKIFPGLTNPFGLRANDGRYFALQIQEAADRLASVKQINRLYPNLKPQLRGTLLNFE